MNIAVFGGTFNPVHNEHINVAKAAIEELSLDKLFIVPTFLPPHKSGAPAPAEDRLEMLKLAFDGVEKAEISDFEIKNGGKSYSYVTAEKFAAEYPQAKLFFIVGEDMLTDFKTWKMPERILNVADLAVFGRENFAADRAAEKEYFEKTFGKSFVTLGYCGKDDSSTAIRVYSALGLEIADKTPEKVAQYIKNRGLYAGGKYEDYVKRSLPEKRLVHTAEVAVTALKKCKAVGVDENKAYTAAILHDCAKYSDPRDYAGFTLPDGVPQPVVHAFLGAFVAENVLKITDKEIIDAIRYHTSGKPSMSALGKLVFVADMIEKGRDYDGVDRLRRLFDGDFDVCFKECLKEEVLHLLNKKRYIYAETLNAYDYYIKENRN